eukprot:g11869.t1
MRVFTVMENISEEDASIAARVLTETLQKKRLINVDVEVIMAEHAFVEPFAHHGENSAVDHSPLGGELQFFRSNPADMEFLQNLDQVSIHSGGNAAAEKENKDKGRPHKGLPQTIDDLLPAKNKQTASVKITKHSARMAGTGGKCK